MLMNYYEKFKRRSLLRLIQMKFALRNGNQDLKILKPGLNLVGKI